MTKLNLELSVTSLYLGDAIYRIGVIGGSSGGGCSEAAAENYECEDGVVSDKHNLRQQFNSVYNRHRRQNKGLEAKSQN